MLHNAEFTIVKNGKSYTFDELGILALKVLIDPPEQEVEIVDVPGSNTFLDLSEVLTGYPTYKRRNLTWECEIAPEYYSVWREQRDIVLRCLHGQYCEIVLDADPDYHYEGRIAVTLHESVNMQKKITITATCQPYKLLNVTREVDLRLPHVQSRFITRTFVSGMPTSIDVIVYGTGVLYYKTSEDGTVQSLSSGSHTSAFYIEDVSVGLKLWLAGNAADTHVLFSYKDGNL